MVQVVDGFTLVPHLKEYYLDNLHPNCLGEENYGRNLVEVIRRLGTQKQKAVERIGIFIDRIRSENE